MSKSRNYNSRDFEDSVDEQEISRFTRKKHKFENIQNQRHKRDIPDEILTHDKSPTLSNSPRRLPKHH